MMPTLLVCTLLGTIGIVSDIPLKVIALKSMTAPEGQNVKVMTQCVYGA